MASSRCRAKAKSTPNPASQAMGVTREAGDPVATWTDQSRIEVGKNGVTIGRTPPMISGAANTVRPIAATAAWLGTTVAAARAIATNSAGTASRPIPRATTVATSGRPYRTPTTPVVNASGITTAATHRTRVEVSHLLTRTLVRETG